MGTSHEHGHAAGRAKDRGRLRLVLAVTVVVLVAEVVGALVTGSLALLADAGHMATDAAGIVVALSAAYVAARPASPRRTFGLHRAEILAALVNAVVLIGLCTFLVWAGVGRLFEPAQVDALPMVGFALVGLLANAVSLAVLSRSRGESLNMRGARLEVASDMLGSGLAVTAGLVIWLTGFQRADAIASLLIAGLILPRSFALLRESVSVLMESTPRGLDLADVEQHLAGVAGVTGVHDLHAWTITSGLPSLSAHVTVTDDALAARGVGAVIDDLSHCVAEHFGVRHTTFQVEPAGHQRHEDLGETGCD